MSFDGSISLSKPLLIPDLPQDIITEILSRLPVKTLLRFRSVSKSWLYLMSNPQFIHTHLMKSSNIKNYTHHRLIMKQFSILSGKYGYNPNSCSLHSIFYPPSDINNNNNYDSVHIVELDYLLKDPCNKVSIVGSCNGLVCIVIEKGSIFIWNPLTRESKELPDSGMCLSHYWNSVFGFGYDQLNDDYKVVSIVPKVMIYSLRNNSWGEISDDFPRAHCRFDNGTFVNGALHWPSYFFNIIVSLNLGNETVGQIAAPDYGDRDWEQKISVLEGCLSICCVDCICADIWVMNEYGIRDSWTKLCTIRLTTYQGNYVLFHSSPLFMFMTGEILLLTGGESLVLYDPIYGTFRNPKIPNLSSPHNILGVTVYFESLVSPHMYDNL